MILLKSLLSALLMYSKIPVPTVKWKEENRRYSLCFFPLVGAVIGGILLIWQRLCDTLEINTFLFAAVCTAVPILVTGGIHFDGFCDVVDAQSSHSSRERKLEIMSDPHIGAFAIIHSAVYFLLTAALFSEVESISAMLMISLGFVLSRALSGLAAITFKSAKTSGTLQSFVKPAHKKVTAFTLIILLIFISGAMIYTDAVCGASALITAALVIIYCRFFSYKNYGGITGDLAGYFLQICELAVLTAIIISLKIMEAVL
jgi:adenosylcobinamide-GDP ribazoletransferase